MTLFSRFVAVCVLAAALASASPASAADGFCAPTEFNAPTYAVDGATDHASLKRNIADGKAVVTFADQGDAGTIERTRITLFEITPEGTIGEQVARTTRRPDRRHNLRRKATPGVYWVQVTARLAATDSDCSAMAEGWQHVYSVALELEW